MSNSWKSTTAQSSVSYSKTMQTGVWVSYPNMPRIFATGTGTLTVDSRDKAGTVTSAVFTKTYSNAANNVDFPYFGDKALQIRCTFPNTLTVEVI